jgi:hypothetical protein
LEVAITNCDAFKLVPTAMQVVSIGHAIAFNLVPLGIEVAAVQTLKLSVLSDAAPPPPLIPTATQVVTAEHEIAESRLRLGSAWPVHDTPSCDSKIAAVPLITPIAAQVIALEQETIVIELVPLGAL